MLTDNNVNFFNRTYLCDGCIKTSGNSRTFAGFVFECNFNSINREWRCVRGSAIVEVVLCVQLLHRLYQQLSSVTIDLEKTAIVSFKFDPFMLQDSKHYLLSIVLYLFVASFAIFPCLCETLLP